MDDFEQEDTELECNLIPSKLNRWEQLYSKVSIGAPSTPVECIFV